MVSPAPDARTTAIRTESPLTAVSGCRATEFPGPETEASNRHSHHGRRSQRPPGSYKTPPRAGLCDHPREISENRELRGGGCSRYRTCLTSNSLPTGKKYRERFFFRTSHASWRSNCARKIRDLEQNSLPNRTGNFRSVTGNNCSVTGKLRRTIRNNLAGAISLLERRRRSHRELEDACITGVVSNFGATNVWLTSSRRCGMRSYGLSQSAIGIADEPLIFRL